MKEHHILNLGAGVQSTALYLMSMRGEAPRVDCAIFADTGEEPEAVYKHLAWLQSLNGPEIIVRSAGRLGDDLIRGITPTHPNGFQMREHHRHRFASIPCFTADSDSGETGRTQRQCSKDYKLMVIERAIRRDVLGLKPRQRVPKGVCIFQYFGISWDERSRASRIWERFHVTEESKFKPIFPLVERQWTRANCIDWLQANANAPHEVPRSACTFCPFHSDAEWQALKDRGGADWARAVEIDAALRTEGNVVNRDMRQTMYVHRSCQPLTQIDFHPRVNAKELQLGIGFDYECEGVCGL